MKSTSKMLAMKRSQEKNKKTSLNKENCQRLIKSNKRYKEGVSSRKNTDKSEMGIVMRNKWVSENSGFSQEKVPCIVPESNEEMDYLKSSKRLTWPFKKFKSQSGTCNEGIVSSAPNVSYGEAGVVDDLKNQLREKEKLYENKLKQQKEFFENQQRKSVNVVKMCLKTIQESEQREKLIPKLEMEITSLKTRLSEQKSNYLSVFWNDDTALSTSDVSDYVSSCEENNIEQLEEKEEEIRNSTSQAIHDYFENYVFK